MEPLRLPVECPACSIIPNNDEEEIICPHNLNEQWMQYSQSIYLPKLIWTLKPKIHESCTMHPTMSLNLKCITCSSHPFCFHCFTSNKLHHGHRITKC